MVNKLADCLHGRITTPAQVADESTTQRQSRQQEERELKRLQEMVWVELVQCLDKQSINFVRPQKPNGQAAWQALVQRHKSSQGPRAQAMLDKLTSHAMGSSGESIIEYLTTMEVLRMELGDAGETMTDSMFKLMVFRGLSKEFDGVKAVLRFGQEKTYE